MAVGDAHVFPGFLTPVLIQLFFPKPPTTFLTCFCRGERRKYAVKKSRLNWGSNSKPPGLESDTRTTEPPGWGSMPKVTFFSHWLLFWITIVNKLSLWNTNAPATAIFFFFFLKFVTLIFDLDHGTNRKVLSEGILRWNMKALILNNLGQY